MLDKYNIVLTVNPFFPDKARWPTIGRPGSNQNGPVDEALHVTKETLYHALRCVSGFNTLSNAHHFNAWRRLRRRPRTARPGRGCTFPM